MGAEGVVGGMVVPGKKNESSLSHVTVFKQMVQCCLNIGLATKQTKITTI